MRRLVIRPGAIGDCILSFPALEFLKAAYTEYWVPSAIEPLIDFGDKVCSIASSGIEMVGIGDLAMSQMLRTRLQSFDQIVSWYGANRPEFRQAVEAVGVPCQFHQALPPPNVRVHASDFFSAQVGGPAGGLPRIAIEAQTKRNAVIIHPFSGGRRKNWPLSSFRQLASELGVQVEWLAGPEELLPDAKRFENLRDLAKWLSGAKAYIGNDSGITHLAAAVGVPVMVLFAKTSPEVWAPRGSHVEVAMQDGLDIGRLASTMRERWMTMETCK